MQGRLSHLLQDKKNSKKNGLSQTGKLIFLKNKNHSNKSFVNTTKEKEKKRKSHSSLLYRLENGSSSKSSDVSLNVRKLALKCYLAYFAQ